MGDVQVIVIIILYVSPVRWQSTDNWGAIQLSYIVNILYKVLKNMKKITAAVLAGMVSMTAQAGPLEKGETSLTVYMNMSDTAGTKSTTIATGMDAAISEAVTIGAGVTMSKSGSSSSTVGLDARARMHFGAGENAVPYVGAGFSMSKSTGSTAQTGFKVEGGVLLPINETADVDVNYNSVSYSGSTSTSLNAGIRVTF